MNSNCTVPLIPNTLQSHHASICDFLLYWKVLNAMPLHHVAHIPMSLPQYVYDNWSILEPLKATDHARHCLDQACNGLSRTCKLSQLPCTRHSSLWSFTSLVTFPQTSFVIYTCVLLSSFPPFFSEHLLPCKLFNGLHQFSYLFNLLIVTMSHLNSQQRKNSVKFTSNTGQMCSCYISLEPRPPLNSYPRHSFPLWRRVWVRDYCYIRMHSSHIHSYYQER